MNLLTKVVGKLPGSWIKAVSRAQWRHPLLKYAFDWCAAMLRNEDAEIQQGVGKGLRFNPGHANAGYVLGTSEPAVQSALKACLRPGMIVYDVGANVGFHTVIAARLVGPSGCVVSFEPLASNARQVEYNARLNGLTHVIVRCEALGATNGEARFLVSAERTLGKLASSDSTVSGKIGEIMVPVWRLDDLLAQGGMPRPDLIKIDVEGAECDVLAGAAKTLRTSRPILMIELHGTNAAVAAALNALEYHPVVLGSADTIIDSPWDAYVIAAPKERSHETSHP